MFLAVSWQGLCKSLSLSCCSLVTELTWLQGPSLRLLFSVGFLQCPWRWCWTFQTLQFAASLISCWLSMLLPFFILHSSHFSLSCFVMPCRSPLLCSHFQCLLDSFVWLPEHPPISLSWFSVSQTITADPWSLLCSFPCGSGAEFKRAGEGWLSELPDPSASTPSAHRWECQELVGQQGSPTPCLCYSHCPMLCTQPAQHSRFLVSAFAPLPAALQMRSGVLLYSRP